MSYETPPQGPPKRVNRVMVIPDPNDRKPEQFALESEEQLCSFAICGLAGMGETELAVEYAYSRKDNFEAVFWLGADDTQILASNFTQITRQLGLEDGLADIAASRDVAMA
jgi:hypothetical protein